MDHSEITDLPFLAPRPKYLPDRRLVPTRKPVGRLAALADERRRKSERRATPRMVCELEVEERVNGWRYFRITSDLSTFGLSTRHGSPVLPGTRLELLLHLPDALGTPLALSAVVLGSRGPEGGVRLAFRSPPRDAVQRIHKFILARSARRLT